jgi:hypothetical protein
MEMKLLLLRILMGNEEKKLKMLVIKLRSSRGLMKSKNLLMK